MSAQSMGYQFGQMIAPIIPLAIGIGVSLYLRKKRGGDKVPGWPILIGLFVSLMTCVAKPSGEQGQSGNRVNQSSAQAESEVVEVVDEMPEADYPNEIDESVLARFQADTTRALEEHYLQEFGKLTPTISTTKLGGKTIIVFDAIGSKGPRVTEYVGVIDGRRRVASCVSMSGDSFPACLAKATQIFGAASGVGTNG